MHHREDEDFYILEGRYLFHVGNHRFKVVPGDLIFVPRDTPYCVRNIGSTPGTILLTVEPAGLEAFFKELAAVEGPPAPATVAPIFVKYGLELLGPPLGDQ